MKKKKKKKNYRPTFAGLRTNIENKRNLLTGTVKVVAPYFYIFIYSSLACLYIHISLAVTAQPF